MPRTSFDDWFDRELAELKAGLEKLEASLEPLPPQPLEKRKPAARPAARVKRPGGRPRKTAAQADTTPPASTVQQVTSTASEKEPKAPALQQPATTGAAPSAPTASASAAPSQPAPSARPTGSDLSDPKNFGVEPPTADLERGASGPEDYRQRLTRHIAFATRVLHTSGVPAAVWREWRTFERAAQDRLRELNARPPDPDLEG